MCVYTYVTPVHAPPLCLRTHTAHMHTTHTHTYTQVYGVLPAATLFMVLYSKMASIFTKDQLFYVTSLPFFAFYTLFAFVLYPNRNIIHPPIPADMDERSLRLPVIRVSSLSDQPYIHAKEYCNTQKRGYMKGFVCGCCGGVRVCLCVCFDYQTWTQGTRAIQTIHM